MKRNLLLLLMVFQAGMACAYHIAGGDLTTRWLGGNTYEIRLTLYRDCSNPNAANFDPTIIIGAYTLNGSVLQDSFHVDLTSITPLQLAGAGCLPPPEVCMEQGDYIRTVQLPPSSGGYYLVWERCCRNITVTNLLLPGQTGMAFYHEMADPSLQNSSPTFNSPPLPYTCAGQYFRFNFNASDADGDSLVYALTNPLAGGNSSNQDPNPYSTPASPGGGNLVPAPKPYSDITWEFGYGLSNICGSATPLTINTSTGEVEGIPDDPGFYAMAVTIYEYRNGQLIGAVRREIEFTVIVCNDNSAPNLSPSVNNMHYEIYASDTLCFKVKARDPDGDSLFLVHRGEVFSQSPAQGLSAPFAVSSDTSGLDSLEADFCWFTSCGQSRDSAYKVVYEIRDNGCPIPLTSLGKVSILVKPVPVVSKPRLLCLEMNAQAVTVFKNPQPEILPRYFKNFKLYRSSNGGPYQLIKVSEDPQQLRFTDSLASDPSQNDYCYYINGTNSCGEEGLYSDTICTITQLNTTVNYIKSVSVTKKNLVTLSWSDFPDGVYGTYVIEKRINEPGTLFTEVDRLYQYADYEWSDFAMLTDATSYCYRMKNYDYCENESAYSNEACTIVLQGSADQYSNTLQWNEYREWNGGVESYTLERAGENASGLAGTFLPLAQLSPLHFDYIDQDIPLSGGTFTYKIRARQAPGHEDAESLSNEVELVQPPLMFIPNAFTPNNDAVNNGWGPSFAFVQTVEVSVFNRWGQRVYFSRNPEERWDGRFNNTDCPQGVYLFRVRFSGFDKKDILEKSGTVSLIR
ncbi:MAG: gliding motility-associated C-terminal domain-containing protein [Bacteroidia bacterium]|nr:gliding motility-associated C-terminal domain-containing protein [Bacteroidia bacterium]